MRKRPHTVTISLWGGSSSFVHERSVGTFSFCAANYCGPSDGRHRTEAATESGFAKGGTLNGSPVKDE
jgi:hypothetical protein